MRTQITLPKWHSPPIFGPYLLWPNGSMDQDATWCGGRPRPRRHCVRWGPSSLSPKMGHNLPVFGLCLLWPNGCPDQPATWHGGRPRPRPHWARWGPSSPPPKGAQPPSFSARLLWPNGRPSQLLLSTCAFCCWFLNGPYKSAPVLCCLWSLISRNLSFIGMDRGMFSPIPKSSGTRVCKLIIEKQCRMYN